MNPVEPSILGLAELVPGPDTTDTPDRLERLAERLRTAPASGPGSEVFDMATAALNALGPEPATTARAMCWLFITRQKFASGRPFEGLTPSLNAVGIAERVAEPALLAKAFKMLGVIYVETSNYPDAVSAYSRALTEAKTAGDAFQEAEILSNLGVAHQYASQFSTAVPCYERATEIAEAAATPAVGRALPLMNLAFASLYLRDYARGLDAAERAIAVLGESHSADEKRHRVMAEFYYTHLLLASRNVPRAVERARLARMHAHGAGALAELFAEMAQGLAEVYDRATRDIGLSRLQGAVNKARLGIPSALRIALATLVRAYEAAGQPNSALIYYQEVMQLNRDSRVKNLIEHQQLFINRRLKELDAQADAALALQKEEIKFRRFSMDVFSELTLLLEENSVAAELHDDDTGEHCYRVGSWASELARKKGLDEDSCVELDISARLHDIGKLEVPDTILLKPGKFTPEERAIMEQHCEFGWRLLQRGGLGQLFVAQEIALNHHERWDGTGYPRKISGEMIPLAARITAIGDVYDALTSKRTYKDAWPHEKAISYIAENRGKHFDPELTDMFLELVPDLQKEHGNLNAYLARKKRSDFIENRERVARELKTDLGTFDARR